jgi:alkyldihydroxyacetonephosphate synthase
VGEGHEKLAQALRHAIPGLRASADAADRTLYARDLWPRHHLEVRAGSVAPHRPGAIAWPTSTEEVADLVRWARREGVPLVPFGAGSGVCAGVLPRGDVVVVDVKRLARIRAIDPEAPSVDVEAGHMGLPLEQALGRRGFTLGHFPSSILCSTVGGWVAARSAGQCSSAYGKIEDMVAALECVTGQGDTVVLRRRTNDADLTPLLIGSEGTLGIVTSATLRLHPAPSARSFGAWSFPSIEHGMDGMRALLQAGLRPAVLRLYDPFDAMLARRASHARVRSDAQEQPRPPSSRFAGIALRTLVGRPGMLNDLLARPATERILGGALLVAVFEGTRETTQRGISRARGMLGPMLGAWKGEGPAQHWLEHRYAVSYRQAPMFANGAFVDTFEVAAPWSKLSSLYRAVREALGRHVFVMAHLSHGYPDGCCIYFSFAGGADPGLAGEMGWDAACEATYDRAWRAALDAAVEAGGTLAHHHGVGRSKAPRLQAELGGDGVAVVRALMRAFDPSAIMNPGNLVPSSSPSSARADALSEQPRPGMHVDRESLLARIEGTTAVAQAERALNQQGLTLGVHGDPEVGTLPVAEWLARGAPGSRDPWLDPVDHLLAGLDATLAHGRRLAIRPSPRRAVGPDLTALVVGAGGRFGRVDRAWLRVHRFGTQRPMAPRFRADSDPPVDPSEGALLDDIARALEQCSRS